MHGSAPDGSAGPLRRRSVPPHFALCCSPPGHGDLPGVIGNSRCGFWGRRRPQGLTPQPPEGILREYISAHGTGPCRAPRRVPDEGPRSALRGPPGPSSRRGGCAPGGGLSFASARSNLDPAGPRSSLRAQGSLAPRSRDCSGRSESAGVQDPGGLRSWGPSMLRRVVLFRNLRSWRFPRAGRRAALTARPRSAARRSPAVPAG